MTISFKDFHGKFLKESGCIDEPDLEPIGRAVELANQWIVENMVKVINVETVMINFNRKSVDTLQLEGMQTKYRNTQIVRVWHLD